MSTMEHMFMQIFSRKRTIEDQFKHQVYSYGENLASNLLSEGLLPPPWLWNPRSDGPDPRELNREQLISEILDQHPRATTPAKSNIYIVQDLKKTNVNLFSNIIFSEKYALNNFGGIKNGDEFVSKDVHETSKKNSKTRVEAEIMEKQLTQTPLSHNDTNSHPSKKAKTLNNLVEENGFLEFTGRVTRSMSTGQKHGYVKYNDSVSQSGSMGNKCQSLDPPSIMTQSHKISNFAHDGSVLNKSILDDLTAYTTNDACQLANTLSSKLCAISLLPESDIHLAETIECDGSPTSKFDQENDEEILHNSRTVSRIEESLMDTGKKQIDEFIKIAKPSSSIQVSCKSFEETPASDRDVEECHANSNEAFSNIQSTNRSESKYAVEREEFFLNDNLVTDSDTVLRLLTVCNHNGDESAHTAETDVQTIKSNVNISLPLTNHLHEIVYDSSPGIGNTLNSFRDFSAHPTLVQNVVADGSDGEKSAGQVANEALEVHVQEKSTDPSAELDAERSSSLLLLSQNDFRSPDMISDEKSASREISMVERKTPDAKENREAVQTRYSLRSSTSHNKDHGSSTLSGITNSCNLNQSMDKGHDNTWPKWKGNKNQFINALDTIPRLRVKKLNYNKPVDCAGKKSSDNISGAIFESQPAMASQNMEVELPGVSVSQFRVEQISKKPQTLEPVDCIGKKSSDNISGAIYEFQPSMPFQNTEVELPEALSGSQSRVERISKKRQTLEPVNCIGKRSSDIIPGANFEFHPAMTPQNTEAELPEAESWSQFREEQISKKPRTLDGEQELVGKCHASDDQEVNTGDEYFSMITDCNVLNSDKCSSENVVNNSSFKLGKSGSAIKNKSGAREESLHNLDGSSMFSENCKNVVVNLDQNLPDFVGFNIGNAPLITDRIISSDSKISNLSKKRASWIEQLCKSENILSMESRPLDDNVNNIHEINQSFPADILGQPSLSNSCHNNGSNKNQPSTSNNVRTTEKYPSTPPQKKITRKSYVSGEELGSNPELVCFRIDENSSVSHGESTSDHLVNSSEVCRSPNITVLADATSKYQNIMPTSDSVPWNNSSEVCRSPNITVLADTTSKYQNIMPTTDSVPRKNTERETFDSVKLKSRLKSDFKENINLIGKQSHVSTSSNSLLRIPSAKATNKNTVRTSSERWSKSNNIISNISSFIPLVKEKQQTAVHASGKRDIKVKALEAAEAAKRLEEKKQLEREMKKAAAKLERARLEQENIRQLEVKQKQKEELRKKKEAENEAKKRQRGAEQAQKEKKRRCTEEARRQQRAHDKNIQDKNEGVKKRKGKELTKEVKKLTKASMVSREATSVVSKPEPDNVNDFGAPLQEKMVASSGNLQNVIQDRMSATAEGRELGSYEFSPYKDTDDEDGDEDYMRGKKFVPSWARKEPLSQIIFSNCHINPTAVFSRKRSFDIAKVLAPPQVNRRPLP